MRRTWLSGRNPIPPRRKERFRGLVFAAVMLVTIASGPALADEVVFLSGNRLQGKVVSLSGGQLVFDSDEAGEVTLDLDKIKTFSSDDPVRVRMGSTAFDTAIAQGPEGMVEIQRSSAAAQEEIPFSEITAINPEAGWSGDVMFSGVIARGNTEEWEIGSLVDFRRVVRFDHRFYVFADYFYSRSRNEEGIKSTTDNFGEGLLRYERDLPGKWFADGKIKVRHDSFADLQFRLTPTVAIGRRWFEESNLSLSTELGVAYTTERYEPEGSRSYWGPNLASAFEWNPFRSFTVFNTIDYYPSFEDFGRNFFIDVNLGVRSRIWRRLFLEIAALYEFDNLPAPGARKGVIRIIIGPGWNF